MPHINRRLLVGGTLAVSLLAHPVAHAAPVTVNVRVEGPTTTLLDTQVTGNVRTWKFSNDATEHDCDGTASTGGSSPTPVTVANNALLTALDTAGLTVTGAWYDGLGPSIQTIGGVTVQDFANAPYPYLVEYKNFVMQDLGGCATPIAGGDQILYGYGAYGSKALKLSGPATLAPGATGTVTVTDPTAAVAGAAVGGTTTAADGTAQVGPFSQRGDQPLLKATKDGAIRSNALKICVTDGADGFCGTTKPGAPAPPPAPPCATLGDDGLCGTADTRAPGGSIGSVKEQQRFAKGKGPRTLAGEATDAQGIRAVRLRLTRNDRGRCATFDGARERFVTLERCGATRGAWFAAGTSGTWSYLLPARLPRGRYVLDVEATDGAGNVDRRLERGRNRIVFHVA